jgi:hypothetical protein
LPLCLESFPKPDVPSCIQILDASSKEKKDARALMHLHKLPTSSLNMTDKYGNATCEATNIFEDQIPHFILCCHTGPKLPSPGAAKLQVPSVQRRKLIDQDAHKKIGKKGNDNWPCLCIMQLPFHHHWALHGDSGIRLGISKRHIYRCKGSCPTSKGKKKRGSL